MENTYVIDVDGTICPIKGDDEEYKDLDHNENMRKALNLLYDSGYGKIIFFTARGMQTYKNDVNEINKHVKPVLEKWLKDHGFRYHELVMGKPWGKNVHYVDDKGLTPNEFLFSISEILPYLNEDIK